MLHVKWILHHLKCCKRTQDLSAVFFSLFFSLNLKNFIMNRKDGWKERKKNEYTFFLWTNYSRKLNVTAWNYYMVFELISTNVFEQIFDKIVYKKDVHHHHHHHHQLWNKMTSHIFLIDKLFTQLFCIYTKFNKPKHQLRC